MPKDEIDAGEVLKKLAELKRTLPEDQYQEIEREVLPRLAGHFGGIEPAQKKSQIRGVLGVIAGLAVLVVLVALSVRFPWLRYIWYAWLVVYAVGWVLQVVTGLLEWLKDAMKPLGRY
jgi:predicted acyltransferase